MKRNQREIFMKLITFCDEHNFDVLQYNVGSDIASKPDNAMVVGKNLYNACEEYSKLQYFDNTWHIMFSSDTRYNIRKD